MTSSWWLPLRCACKGARRDAGYNRPLTDSGASQPKESKTLAASWRAESLQLRDSSRTCRFGLDGPPQR